MIEHLRSGPQSAATRAVIIAHQDSGTDVDPIQLVEIPLATCETGGLARLRLRLHHALRQPPTANVVIREQTPGMSKSRGNNTKGVSTEARRSSKKSLSLGDSFFGGNDYSTCEVGTDGGEPVTSVTDVEMVGR